MNCDAVETNRERGVGGGGEVFSCSDTAGERGAGERGGGGWVDEGRQLYQLWAPHRCTDGTDV